MEANQRIVISDPWRAVHDAIRDSIIAGEYEPGSRLLERQLAERFGTSRGPIRSALQELERVGLVVSEDRRGTFVRSVSAKDREEIDSLWTLIWASRFNGPSTVSVQRTGNGLRGSSRDRSHRTLRVISIF